MDVVGIETSGATGWVVLCRDGECLEERRLEAPGGRHARALPATVASLLADHDLAPVDCDLVAVSIGPGSFTGLRVGVVFAKTLAWTVGCPLVAVETLAVVAATPRCDVDDLLVIADAGRDELYFGRYRRTGNNDWSRTGTITIEPADDWCRARTASEVVVGTELGQIADRLPAECRMIDPGPEQPRAEAVARLGLARLQRGEADDPASLEPLYVRRSAAEEKRSSK